MHTLLRYKLGNICLYRYTIYYAYILCVYTCILYTMHIYTHIHTYSSDILKNIIKEYNILQWSLCLLESTLTGTKHQTWSCCYCEEKLCKGKYSVWTLCESELKEFTEILF